MGRVTQQQITEDMIRRLFYDLEMLISILSQPGGGGTIGSEAGEEPIRAV